MSKQRLRRAYSVSNVLTKKFNPLEFEGEWKDTLGTPDKSFSAIIWGGSGSGKTESAMKLGKYLTNFGIVDYNSMEEGLSSTIQQAYIRNHLENCESSFRLLDKWPYEEMMDRMNSQKSADFMFNDSVQYMRMTKQQYYQMKELAVKKNKGLIWVSQAKGKEPKGALADDIRYDVDLKLYVEGFKLFPGGRLNGGGEPFIIDPIEAAKYWKEIV